MIRRQPRYTRNYTLLPYNDALPIFMDTNDIGKIVGCTGNGAVHPAKILDVRAKNEINAGAHFGHPGIRTLDNMVELAVDRVDIIARPAFQQVGIATGG